MENKRGRKRGGGSGAPPPQNPLSLLQQQMSAIMGNQGSPAAAWWYLEYLSRVQQEGQMEQQQQQQQRAPPPERPSTSQQQQHNNHPPKKPQKQERRRDSRSKQPQEILNLCKTIKTELPAVEKKPAVLQHSSSSTTPPPAHSTPTNLSTQTQRTNSSSRSSPPPAHSVVLSPHYTHPILPPPQLGLINRPSKKKKTVASLLHQKEIIRPWVESPRLTIPTPATNYDLPLKKNWKRMTQVKNLKTLEGVVSYTTPQGVVCRSINEVKKQLNQRTAELTPKHFSFGNLNLGTFIFDFEGSTYELEYEETQTDLLSTLRSLKEKRQKKKENERRVLEEKNRIQIELERKRQHVSYIKMFEKLKKKLQKKSEVESEVEQDFELKSEKGLMKLSKLETSLDAASFSNLLQIYEFLHTFGETLGFDMDSLPDLESLLKGFINQQTENEEELQSILIHLIVCAVEDPGMPNPNKHMTSFNQTLKQADVNFGSLSEILRIYLEGISDSEPEAELYSTWLGEAPFTCHNPLRKTKIVAFVCDVLLQNKAVLKFLENSSENVSNFKKEKQGNEVKLRKLRMAVARRAVAESSMDCEVEGDIDDEDKKLSVEELKMKVQSVGALNEKLLKSIQSNCKNIRTSQLGQDRWRRRYWNLEHSGGIFVEGGVSGESEEIKEKVKSKFENSVQFVKEVVEVPRPCINIFSFANKENCVGVGAEGGKRMRSEDDLFLEKIEKEEWFGYFKLEELDEFRKTLFENGLREGSLKANLENVEVKSIPEFEDSECPESEYQVGIDPDLVYKIHLGLIETLESLEERVAGASLQIKNWSLPLPRNLHLSGIEQGEIVGVVRERLLDLEQAVERRYLKPPLGKSANELCLSNLVGEENVGVVGELGMVGPCGSTSSTRGQQIQEKWELIKIKEKEEKLAAANLDKNSSSRFLTHWRESIRKTTSPSVLSMAIYLLDSSIAWDKSVMKACCQLCKGGDNEDKLLLCDSCDRGYHTYCFKPPLEQIPEGDWFCWECINKATGQRGCIVCGKGNLPGKKMLMCDKCVKAYHTDCLRGGVVGKIPRGRWYCSDHQPATSPIRKMESPKKKRPASPDPSEKQEEERGSEKKSKRLTSELIACEKVLDALIVSEDAWPFVEPVNTRQFPTYRKIIKTPMDLSTIKKLIPSYKSKEDFLTDVRLIFSNCETFNEDDSPVGKAGHNLRLYFESLLSSISSN